MKYLSLLRWLKRQLRDSFIIYEFGKETDFWSFSEFNKIEQWFRKSLNSEVCILMKVMIRTVYEG